MSVKFEWGLIFFPSFPFALFHFMISGQMMLEWQVEMLFKSFDYYDENKVLLALLRHNV